MSEKVPRRMKRLQRNNNTQTNYAQTSYKQSSTKQDFVEENYSDTSLPTMDYEDVTTYKKNAEELKKIEQMNLEQKIALLEVEKFKKHNNRLPNKQETEKIADSLYTQFKNNPELLADDLTSFDAPQSEQKTSAREQRRKRRNQKDNEVEQFADTPTSTQNTNVKDLFSDDFKETKNDNEFDLGLDLDDNTTNSFDDEITEIEDFDKNTCSNCKKPAEKIIYCSNCGTAYCKNCAKEKNNEKVCPQCGTKNG